MRHLVHCSGYSLAEISGKAINRNGELLNDKFRDWEHVCLGDPSLGALGRIPMTLQIAAVYQADCIIWSTGGTFLNGISEARFTFEYALTSHNNYLSAERIRRISVLEEESTNTFTSLEYARRIIISKYTNQMLTLHCVSSANHIPRIARDAFIVFSEDRNIILSMVPAHTSYGKRCPQDVKIKELGN